MKSPRPFHVSTFGLSPNVRRIHPAFGRIQRGDVSRQKLFEVFEIYRQLETEWPPSASHITVQSATGRFVIRASEKRLILGVEGEPVAKSVPLAAEEIVTRMDEPAGPLTLYPPPPPPEPLQKIGVAMVPMLAGVALIVYALAPLLAPKKTPVAEDFALVTDAKVLRTQQRALTGLFATGQQLGDRHLTISANGNILFAEIGPRNAVDGRTDSFRVGQREKKTGLLTVRNGIIYVVDPNTLVYYGDTYRRQK